MARMQRDGRTVDMQARFSFGDAVDASEGGADMLPVPVAVVSGKADIEHLKVKRFNRYLHVAYLCLIQIGHYTETERLFGHYCFFSTLVSVSFGICFYLRFDIARYAFNAGCRNLLETNTNKI